MPARMTSDPAMDAATRDFYCRALTTLQSSGVPFLIGGAYAFAQYTGIVRHTKDLDVFVRERDFAATLDVLAAMPCRTEVTAPEWLGKAICGDDFVDVIFASGNGLGRVDDLWFERAPQADLLSFSIRLCSPEDMVWSKAFVQERERFDGADVSHLLRARAHAFDWAYLLQRFGAHWRVLLSNLILFGYSYPSERDHVPAGVMRELLGRFERELDTPAPSDPICYGTLLSVAQYATDVERWGYKDARTDTGGETLRAFEAKRERDQTSTAR